MKQKQLWTALAVLLAIGVGYQNCAAPLDGDSGEDTGLRIAGYSVPTPTPGVTTYSTPAPSATPVPTPTPDTDFIVLTRFYNSASGDHAFGTNAAAFPGYVAEASTITLYKMPGANRVRVLICSRTDGRQLHLMTKNMGDGNDCEAQNTGNGYSNPVDTGGYVIIGGTPPEGSVLLTRTASANNYPNVFLQLLSADPAEAGRAGYTGSQVGYGYAPRQR